MMRLVGLPDTPLHLEIPGINITGVTGFGQSGYPNGWWQTNWHVKDIFTVIKSSHLIKMGGELRQMYGSASNTNNYIPNYQFSNLLNFADDEALQMTRYVDPRTGEPVTAFSELTQTEWALFIDDDWKVAKNFTVNMGLRYENYGTFKDSDDTLRNIILGPGSSFNEQIANARVDFVDRFFATDANNLGPRLGFAWDPKSDGKMSVRGGYGLAFDRLMNLPAENYRHSPPLRASVVLGQQFGTPTFTYSLGDASAPYLGYPVDPALQVGLDERNGVRGARVALTVVDPDLKSPYTHNWFVGVQREIMWGMVAEANYLGSAGRQLHNAYNVNRFVGDLATDNVFTGFNPSFAGITMVRSNSRANYHGGTVTLRRNFRQGYTFQGAYTFGKAMNDADQAVGSTNFQDAANIGARLRARRLRRATQAGAGRAVGDAVLQGQHRPGADAVRRLADRRLGDPAGWQPDQRHHRRGVSDRRLQRRRQRRRSAERARERREDERLERRRVSRRHLPRQLTSRCRRGARTAISCATPIAARATPTSACRCRSASR